MTTVGVTMVRDEEDIIGTTVAHMIAQCDHVLVADNLSTDRTRQFLDRMAADCPTLTVVDDFDPAYEQSRKMTELADTARSEFGAEWIIPFDADELWGIEGVRLREYLPLLSDEIFTVRADLFDYVCSSFDNLDETDPTRRIRWRRPKCNPLPKVACRWRPSLVIEMGNHGASYEEPSLQRSGLTVRHYPYRSTEQVVRKIRNGAAALKAANLDSMYGAHWRQWGEILEASGEEAIEGLFLKWYTYDRPDESKVVDGESLPPLIYDPAFSASSPLGWSVRP